MIVQTLGMFILASILVLLYRHTSDPPKARINQEESLIDPAMYDYLPVTSIQRFDLPRLCFSRSCGTLDHHIRKKRSPEAHQPIQPNAVGSWENSVPPPTVINIEGKISVNPPTRCTILCGTEIFEGMFGEPDAQCHFPARWICGAYEGIVTPVYPPCDECWFCWSTLANRRCMKETWHSNVALVMMFFLGSACTIVFCWLYGKMAWKVKSAKISAVIRKKVSPSEGGSSEGKDNVLSEVVINEVGESLKMGIGRSGELNYENDCSSSSENSSVMEISSTAASRLGKIESGEKVPKKTPEKKDKSTKTPNLTSAALNYMRSFGGCFTSKVGLDHIIPSDRAISMEELDDATEHMKLMSTGMRLASGNIWLSDRPESYVDFVELVERENGEASDYIEKLGTLIAAFPLYNMPLSRSAIKMEEKMVKALFEFKTTHTLLCYFRSKYTGCPRALDSILEIYCGSLPRSQTHGPKQSIIPTKPGPEPSKNPSSAATEPEEHHSDSGLSSQATPNELYPNLTPISTNESTSSTPQIPQSVEEPGSSQPGTLGKPLQLDDGWSDATPKRKKKGGPSKVNLSTMVFLIVMVTIPVVDSCSAVISVGNKINIWHEGVLEESFHSYLTVPVGGTICMKENGIITKRILIQSAYQVAEYYPAYKTSSFDVKVISYSRCLSASDCPGKCTAGSSPVPDTFPPVPNSLVNRTGCFADTTNCEGYCFRSEQCAWYYWSVHPKGQTGLVLHLARTHMEVELKISTGGSISVDSVSPTKDVLLGGLSVKLVTGGVDTHIVPQSLLFYQDRHFHVPSSPSGSPESLKAGDLQLQLTPGSHISSFPNHIVQCTSHYCKVSCTSPPPFMDRDLSRNAINAEQTGAGAKVRNPADGKVLLALSLDKEFDLAVNTADCDFSYYSSSGCTDCTDDSFVVIRRTNIISSGLVSFESDCSFSRNYLSCGPLDQVVTLLEKTEKNCTMFYGKNKTLTFNFNPEFTLGFTDLSSRYSSGGVSGMVDKLSYIVTSDGFKFGQLFAYGGMMGLVVFSIVTKIIWMCADIRNK